jgi:hypothetical protein
MNRFDSFLRMKGSTHSSHHVHVKRWTGFVENDPEHAQMKSNCLIALLFMFFCSAQMAQAQDTTITYQGQLRQGGESFTGLANLEFRLYDQLAGGSQVGPTQSRVNWPVEDGLFQVELDFGANAFTSQARFLEVRVNGTPLSPRQAVRPSPMALFALAGNEGPAGPPGASPFTLDTTTGDIEYLHNNQVFRFEPDVSSTQAPTITLGYGGNSNPTRGSVIAGGGNSSGANQITAGNYSVIGGGWGNSVTQSSGTISGGINNSAGQEASIGGGRGNSATSFATIPGGISNTASGISSTVGGGESNTASGQHALVSGGTNNAATGSFSTVGGGGSNVARGNRSVVSGGVLNSTMGGWSTVTGGYSNCAGGSYSWAGGRQAKVRTGSALGTAEQGCENVPLNGTIGDSGTFVWADSTSADYISSGSNQFLVRASGGAVISSGSNAVNDPAGNRLRVQGTVRIDSLGTAGSTALCWNNLNQISTCSSSERYKRDIDDLDIDSALLDALRPVRYHWIDSGEADIGFVAEEIAALAPELVTRNAEGEVEGIKYDRITALLVSFLQEEREERARLGEEVAALKVQLDGLAELAEQNHVLEGRLAALESLLLEGRRTADVR